MNGLVAVPLLVVLAAVSGDLAASRSDGARRVPIVRLGGSLQNPCFSPDSKRLVITQWPGGYNEGRAEVQLVRIGGGAALGRISPPGDSAVNLPGTCWHGPSDRIAFSFEGDEPDAIFTARPDGSDPRLAVALPGRVAFEPSFSPDGQHLVFEVHPVDVDGRGEIWVAATDGSMARRITQGADDRQPNWSPTGKAIVFQRQYQGNWDLWTVSPGGGPHKNITRTRGVNETDASWAPSGRWIVYSGDGTDIDIASLFTIGSNGKARRRLTTAGRVYDGAPSWSPDGKTIAFESRGGEPDGSSGTSIWTILAPPDRQ